MTYAGQEGGNLNDRMYYINFCSTSHDTSSCVDANVCVSIHHDVTTVITIIASLSAVFIPSDLP